MYMNQQPPDSPVNLEQLNQISEGDIEFEIEVLHVYVEDVSQRIEKIHDAITRDDWSKLWVKHIISKVLVRMWGLYESRPWQDNLKN